MASFENALSVVLEHERGFSNHPQDAGGPTNWGITLATFSAYLKRTATLEEVQAMPLEMAKQIYRVSYWGVIQGDSIRSDALATNFFDMAVLRGVVAATKTMQGCVGVTTDGYMGPKTLAAINAANPSDLILSYYLASQAALVNLVVIKPTNLVFLNGWMKRVGDMLKPVGVALRQRPSAVPKVAS